MRRRRFLATAAIGVLGGCAGADGSDGTPPSTTTASTPTTTTSVATTTSATDGGPDYGVSLSPRSFGGEEFTAFLELAADAGSVLRWAGDWAELGRPEAAPALVASVARRHGLEPMIETGVFSAGDRELFRPLTPETRARYVEDAAAFCAEHAPPYLGVGVEVDTHYETDPASFETFVDLFAETYDAVKSALPDTAVYPGFQLERLRGLRGGLFGGENDPESASWELLDRFPDADLTAITTYPGLVFGDPDEVPDDYFDALAARTDRPIAVTETGWSAETKGTGWGSDEAEQAAFVRRLPDLLGGVDLAALVWLWLFEQSSGPAAFTGMGLRRADGSARPAWDAWVAAVAGTGG